MAVMHRKCSVHFGVIWNDFGASEGKLTRRDQPGVVSDMTIASRGRSVRRTPFSAIGFGSRICGDGSNAA